MNKRTLLNIVLLFVVLALAGVAVFQSSDQDEVAGLTGLRTQDINEISISLSNKEPVLLARKASDWNIIEPIEAGANPFRVKMLLQLAEARSYASYPVQSLDLKRYQLNPPLGSIRFNDKRLSFGGVEPLNRRRYVLADGAVQLIAERYFYQTMVTLPALLDPAILPSGSELNKIELPDFSVMGDSKGGWKIVDEAHRELASMDDVNAFIQAWQHAQAMKITPYNNDSAEGLIRVYLADGSLFEFELLQTESELILGRRDIAMRYHFGAQQLQRLLGFPGSLKKQR